MIEFPFIILTGALLSSAHCIGMCGGFAASVGVGSSCFSNNMQRQVIYSIGRIFTYVFLGTIAGFAGVFLNRHLNSVMNFQGTISVIAGILLVQQGLQAAGWFPSFTQMGKFLMSLFRSSKNAEVDPLALPVLNNEPSGCVTSSFFASFLNAPGWKNIFIAGIMTGFLPCGLVYAFLALAMRAETVTSGMLTMVLFGLGTVPAMILTGVGAGMLPVASRQKMFRVAAICVAVMGMLTVSRGLGYMKFSETDTRTGCPLCKEKAETNFELSK